MKTKTVEREREMLKPSKATVWDGISHKILELIAKGIAPSLTRLFNAITEKVQWLCTWKIEEWTPVFKKGDRTEQSNYPPINNLNSIEGYLSHFFVSKLCQHGFTLVSKSVRVQKTQLRNNYIEVNLKAIHGYKQSVWLVKPPFNDSETQGIRLFWQIF